MHYSAESGFDHDAEQGTGILLTNLGTPDAPTPAALKRYLAEFLWDPRVVEMPRPLWWLILHGIILNTRPKKSAAAYTGIWTESGSPLMHHSLAQRDALQQAMERSSGAPVHVELAMRYGSPSIAAGLASLRAKNCKRILVLPLYPQYSATTTGSTFDAVAAELTSWRRVPALRMLDSYHDDPGYIEALAGSVRRHWQQYGEPERLLISFHGIPERYFKSGDPYPCHCRKSARLLAEALGLEEGRWQLSFQSRFGSEPWVTPYTDETLKQWGAEGLGRVDVICPGFAADCLETLEEIAVENAGLFKASGGGELRYIPALNDDAAHIEALSAIASRELSGWS